MKTTPINKRYSSCLIMAALTAAVIINLSAAACAAPPPGSLAAAMSSQTRPASSALGSWHYTIMAETDVIGNVTINSESTKAVAGQMYLLTQTAEFYLGATESRRITVTARMKPDLTLENYQKTVQIFDGDRTVSIERTTITSGTLAVVITKESGRKKETKTLKKTGPIYYPFGAAYIFAQTGAAKPGATYSILAPSPDGKSIDPGELRVTDPTSGSKGGLLVTASVGTDVVVLRLDIAGNVVDYGPPEGDPRFVLSRR